MYNLKTSEACKFNVLKEFINKYIDHLLKKNLKTSNFFTNKVITLKICIQI